MREEHKPNVFEDRVMRRIFGFKKKQVREEWRRSAFSKYYSDHRIKNTETFRACECMGDRKGAYRVLVG